MRDISFFVTFCPSKMISTEVGFSRRLRQRKKVLLPEPEGPTIKTTSPFFIVVLILSSAVTDLNFFTRLRISNIISLILFQPFFKKSEKFTETYDYCQIY